MKRNRLLLGGLSLLLTSSLLSCGGDDPNLVDVTFGTLFDSSLASGANDLYLHTENISYRDLASKIKYQESFVLLVYEYKTLEVGESIDCTCWIGFSLALTAYMKENNARIYGIDPNDFSHGADYYSLKLYTGEATLAIFGDGVLKYQTTNGNDALNSLEKVKKYFSGKLTWCENLLYLSKKQLDGMFEKKDLFLVDYTRKGCPDCSYINRHFLKERGRDYQGKTVYLLECDKEGIRYENGVVNQEKWSLFKDEYGLSSIYNKDWGYGAGYVPTFIAYQPKGNETHKGEAVIDMAVYLNDTLTIENGICKVASTYWDGGRKNPFLASLDASIESNLLGLEIPEGEYTTDTYGSETYTSWNHEAAAKYHDPILKGFLDYYAQ